MTGRDLFTATVDGAAAYEALHHGEDYDPADDRPTRAEADREHHELGDCNLPSRRCPHGVSQGGWA